MMVPHANTDIQRIQDVPMPYVNPNLTKIAILVTFTLFLKFTFDFWNHIISRWWEEIIIFGIGYAIAHVLMSNYSLKSRIIMVILLMLWIKYVLWVYWIGPWEWVKRDLEEKVFLGIAFYVLFKGFEFPIFRGAGPGGARWRPHGPQHRLGYF